MAAKPISPPPSPSLNSSSPFQVLLIEEDPKQSELYGDLIREVAQCRLDVMSRLESSFEWIAMSNYQLVVVDLGANTAQGLTLLEQIKRYSPATGVILLSDNASIEQAVSAVRLGAEDYLKKPFSVEAFQLAVKRSLDRKTVFGDSLGASSFVNLLYTCQMISATLEQKKILGIIQSYFSRELGCAHSAIYTLHEKQPVRLDQVIYEGQQDRAMEEILDIALEASRPFPGLMESNEIFRFADRGQLTPGLFIFRFCLIPGSDYFCVCLSPKKPSAMEAFSGRLKILRAQIDVTGKNIEHYLGIQNLVYVDDATGLYNTRYLNHILDREIMQAEAMGRSFAVLFIDADHFKSINDSHGHLVGTRLLHELGNQLRKLVRDTDIVFRYGGDEFVAVLSPCDLPTAQVVAERIRKSVDEKVFLDSEGLNLHFTVSIGVAIFPEHASSKRAIIDAADQAMYNAKRSTRNSVTIANLQSVPAPKTAEITRIGKK